MKLFLISFVTLFYSFVLNAYDIKVSDGKVEINKYLLNGKPIFDDAEKNRLKSNGAKDSDFHTDQAPNEDKDILTEIESEGIYVTRTSILNELARRKTKSYVLIQMMEIKSKIIVLNQIAKDEQIDVSKELTEFQNKLNSLKVKYSQAQ